MQEVCPRFWSGRVQEHRVSLIPDEGPDGWVSAVPPRPSGRGSPRSGLIWTSRARGAAVGPAGPAGVGGGRSPAAPRGGEAAFPGPQTWPPRSGRPRSSTLAAPLSVGSSDSSALGWFLGGIYFPWLLGVAS